MKSSILLDLTWSKIQFTNYMQQNIKATKEHCRYSFQVLISKLTGLAQPAWPKNLANIVAPLFVTWSKTKDSQLRGCIGTFQAQKLQTVLPQYALISALKDRRFKPIGIDELENLTVQVSLLTNFQKGKKAYDWLVGKHGIIIQFQDKQKSYDATFLPQIAQQQKWTQDQTLKHLIRKAGYRGNYKDVVQKIQLTTYQSSKQRLSYEEYKFMVNNAQKQ